MSRWIAAPSSRSWRRRVPPAATGRLPADGRADPARLSPQRATSCRASPRSSPRCAASARPAAACSRRNREGRVVKLEGNPDHPVSARRAVHARPGRAAGALPSRSLRAAPAARGRRVKRWRGTTRSSWSPSASPRSRGGKKRRGDRDGHRLERGSLGALLDRSARPWAARPRVALGALRLRSDPCRQPHQLRPRCGAVSRLRGRRGHTSVVRRRPARDVALQRPVRARLRARCTPSARARGTFVATSSRASR